MSAKIDKRTIPTQVYSTEDRFRYNSLLLEPDKEA